MAWLQSSVGAPAGLDGEVLQRGGRVEKDSVYRRSPRAACIHTALIAHLFGNLGLIKHLGQGIVHTMQGTCARG